MLAIAHALPPQFARRAATARYIVELEAYYTKIITSAVRNTIADMPLPPDHLDGLAVEDCRAISAKVAIARQTICKSAKPSIPRYLLTACR